MSDLGHSRSLEGKSFGPDQYPDPSAFSFGSLHLVKVEGVDQIGSGAPNVRSGSAVLRGRMYPWYGESDQNGSKDAEYRPRELEPVAVRRAWRPRADDRIGRNHDKADDTTDNRFGNPFL